MKTITFALALAALALAAPAADAQQRFSTRYGSYNQQRAYEHFLRSPAAVKSYSTGLPGRVWGYETPFESVRYTRSPAYYREYVSPYRHVEIDVPSVETRTVIPRPVVVYPTYLPPALYGPPLVVPPRYYR